MNPHFFTAPFYFAFIWFKVQGSRFKAQGSRLKVQGSGLKVQGSGFRAQGSGFRVQGSRGGFAAFFRRWYSRIAAFPSRGRCPAGADRVTMV